MYDIVFMANNLYPQVLCSIPSFIEEAFACVDPLPIHISRLTTFTYNHCIQHTLIHSHTSLIHSPPLQTSKSTTDPGALQKAADFVRAFMLGFDVEVH